MAHHKSIEDINMSLEMIELEEVQKFEASDDALEQAIVTKVAATYHFYCP